jgi:hypothetical protein
MFLEFITVKDFLKPLNCLAFVTILPSFVVLNSVLYLNPKNTQAPCAFLSISCFVLPLEGAVLFIVELGFESQILDASKIVAQFQGRNFRFSAKRLKNFLANLEHCSKSTLQHFFVFGL